MGTHMNSMSRERLTWQKAATPTGLYGSTRAVQRAAEVASRKLARHALKVAKRVFAKDADVVPFLQAHAKREGSKSAKVLLAALKEVGPKLASEMRGGVSKQAGAPDFGLYGFKARTAEIGLDACKEVRLVAGRIAADLHRRKADLHGSLTGFFKEHSKQARCAYAGMLLSCYPDASSKVAAAPPMLVPPDGHELSIRQTGGHEVTARGRLRGAMDVLAWPKGATSCGTPPLGRLTDVEVLPSEIRSFRQAAQERAAGSKVTSVIFVPLTRTLHVAGSDADGQGTLVASFEDERPAILMEAGFTASYTPIEKTVLASGDWLEWE